MNNTLYLIDGHAVLYRYHFAFKDNPMRTSTGVITSAAYGMAKMLTVLMKSYPMTHIGVIFDPPYRTWRKVLYPEYKANRVDKDDISQQIEQAYGMVNDWGVYTGAFKPLEADDVIGILASRAAALGWDVRIATKDKDFTQLVNDKIKLLDLGKTIGKDAATIIDREYVKNKYGVYPEQIVDYLAMIGDTVDNVHGLNGIGPKTAAEYLTEHGTIEGIYNNLSTLTTAKQALFKNWETKDLNRRLIRLALEYPLDVNLDELRAPPLHNPELFRTLEALEFYSIIRTISDPNAPLE